MSLDYNRTPSEQPKAPQTAEGVQLDQFKYQAYLQELRDNQNLGIGILAGIAAAIAGAFVWAIVTAATNFQIGWMAVGVGFIVGWSIRKFGRGVDQSFAIAGAALALLGCALGNLLTTCILIARQQGVEISDVLGSLDLGIAGQIMKETFNPMDLLFYGLAVYFGYKYSLFTIPEEKLKEMLRPV